MANKAEQEEIGLTGEGVERKRVRALDTAIDAWTVVKEKRMKLTEQEVEAKSKVRLLMEENELDRYRFDDDKEVVLVDNVKVRRIETNGAGDED